MQTIAIQTMAMETGLKEWAALEVVVVEPVAREAAALQETGMAGMAGMRIQPLTTQGKILVAVILAAMAIESLER